MVLVDSRIDRCSSMIASSLILCSSMIASLAAFNCSANCAAAQQFHRLFELVYVPVLQGTSWRHSKRRHVGESRRRLRIGHVYQFEEYKWIHTEHNGHHRDRESKFHRLQSSRRWDAEWTRMVIFERLWLVFKDDRPAGSASSSPARWTCSSTKRASHFKTLEFWTYLGVQMLDWGFLKMVHWR